MSEDALQLATRHYGADASATGDASAAGAASPGEPMLLLHGLFGSAVNWHGIASRLGAGRELLAVDLRNHGASPHAPRMDYPAMAEDLHALLDARGWPAATVVGHSMGGKAAMALALGWPERVRRLVVVDVAPVAYGHSFMPLIDAVRRLDLARIDRRADADRLLAAELPEPAVRALLLQNLVRRDAGFGWRIDWDVIAANHEAIVGFPADLQSRRAQMPALFIRGGASDYVLAEHLPLIESMFPAAKLHTIAGAGHWVHVDRPDELVALLRRPAD